MPSRTILATAARRAAAALLVGVLVVASGCLTGKQNTKTPFRGLTSEESDRLGSLNNPGFPKSKAFPAEKEPPAENLIAEGDLYLKTGQLDGSIMSYTRVLAKDPYRHDVRYKLGIVFLMSGQLADAKRELAAVLAHQEMLESHEALGLVFLQEGNYPEAERELRHVLSSDPQRLRALYLLGVTHLKAHNTTAAIAVFRDVLLKEPNNVKAMSRLGQAYYEAKNYSEALHWLKKGEYLHPEDPKLNYYLGMTYAALKRYPEAMTAFTKAGDEAQAFNNIGVQYFLEGRYTDAAKCFQRALELRKTFYPEAKDNLERALKKMQEENQNAG